MPSKFCKLEKVKYANPKTTKAAAAQRAYLKVFDFLGFLWIVFLKASVGALFILFLSSLGLLLLRFICFGTDFEVGIFNFYANFIVRHKNYCPRFNLSNICFC